jgi:serine/threonine protein kinase
MKQCPVCNESFEDSVTFCPRHGEVLQESPETIVGRVVDGKYEVEGFIAQGGMGAVYLARHILLGDRVVLKTLRSEMRTNAEWIKRFQREGKAARAFRHPNSVTVYDLSAGSDGLVYMVMEYVEGHTLDKELKRRGRLTPAETVEVLTPVADVLDAAHARGVIHRDLKPENIMLGRDEHGQRLVKVLDLGIAKIVVGDAYAASVTALTTAGQLLGTPYYMSPEQWGELPRDGVAEVDGRTDIYSLGVIAYELVAGRKPLNATTLAELRQKHVSEQPPPLEEVAPGVSREFGRAVARATAKDRADRPASAGLFIDELREALGLPARAPAPPVSTFERPTHAVSEAATARLTPGELDDKGRADTLLTSEFEGRDTDGARGGGARATVSGEGGETVAGAPGIRRDAGALRTEPPAEAPRRFLVPGVVAVVLALVLFAAAVGVWWFLTRPPAAAPPAPVRQPPAAPAAGPAPKSEVMAYWLEVFSRADAETGRRVAQRPALLETEQLFRFHFNPRRRGYLYIIGPTGAGNELMLFLAAQGAGPLKSNLVVGDADYAFPNWAHLGFEGGAGTEDYTVIFSPTPLGEPAFLTKPSRYKLTPAEVREFEEFRARHDVGASSLEVSDDGGEPRVVVSAPEAATRGGAPVIFDIRIRHE